MSDASQDVPGDTIADRLAGAIDHLLDNWPGGQVAAKITFEMTHAQWSELLDALHAAVPPPGFYDALEDADAQDARAERREARGDAV